MVYLAGVARLDNQADLGARPLANEMVVHRRDSQQRRDGRHLVVRFTVGQDDHLGAAGDGRGNLRAHRLECRTQAGTALGDRVQAADNPAGEAVRAAVDRVGGIEVDQLVQLVVVQHRLRQQDLVARLGRRMQQVTLGTDHTAEAGDDLLADGVQRGIGDLSKKLLEVVEEHPGTVGQHRDRGVGAHRAECLGTGAGHRRHQQVDLFIGVAEHLLAQHDPVMRHVLMRAVRQLLETHQTFLEPLLVRLGRGQLGLDLFIGNNAPLGGVHQEHAAGLQAGALYDGGRVQVQHAGLGGHHDKSVVGHPHTRRPQTVAVQDRADDGAVGEADGRRPIPGLHQGRVEFVERAQFGAHIFVPFPRLGDHHQHRVVQGAATQVQQFQCLVEPRRVRGTARTDREDLLELGRVTEDVGLDERLTGPHPVLVTRDRVDLAVVRHPAIGMC
ncbi:Uncharacterised protein [Mycobacteroides abscessus subsp. massiliense]|nr:Uncharacterised protein [Mycobacteroides abscessus subsp. massiliense]